MAGDEDQRERRFCRLYEANFRPVQAYAVNRLARPDDVAGSRPNSAPRPRNGPRIRRGSGCWRPSAN